MFFIFVFFHFPCKIIILTSLLSVNKYQILDIFKWKYLENDSFACSFVLLECKFCNQLFTVIYVKDFFHVIPFFHSHNFFYFDPCWHTKSCRRMLAVSLYRVKQSLATYRLKRFFYSREKSRSQSSSFWHIWKKHGFYFLLQKLRLSINRLGISMKLIE